MLRVTTAGTEQRVLHDKAPEACVGRAAREDSERLRERAARTSEITSRKRAAIEVACSSENATPL